MADGKGTDIDNMVQTDRELGTKNITHLFIKYGFFTLVGMIAQSIMIVFEGIIIGKGLGSDGLASVGLIMTLEYLILALGGFFAIGISTSAAIKLGDGDKEGARKVYAQGMWFSIIFMLILSSLMFIFASLVSDILGTPIELRMSMIKFIRIFMFFYPFCVIGHIVVYMARVDEKPSIATYALVGSAIFALVWLYLSINVFKLGIPSLGVYFGSTMALWTLGILYFIFSKKTIFKMHLSDLKMSKEIISPILKIGFPYLLIQISSTIFTIVINNFLKKFGDPLHIAAFAIINGYIIYILMMITQSAVGGLQPIASYNIGAKLYGRVSKLIKVAIIGNIVTILAIAIPFFMFSRQVTGLFAGDERELVELSAKYTRLIVIFTAFGLTSSLMSSYFQSIENIKKSNIIGISRYIIFAIPLMYLLSIPLGVEGVWYSQPLADILAFGFSIFYAYKEIKRLNKLESEKLIKV